MILGYYKGHPMTTDMLAPHLEVWDWVTIYVTHLSDTPEQFKKLCRELNVNEHYAKWTCEQADKDLKPSKREGVEDLLPIDFYDYTV